MGPPGEAGPAGIPGVAGSDGGVGPKGDTGGTGLPGMGGDVYASRADMIMVSDQRPKWVKWVDPNEYCPCARFIEYSSRGGPSTPALSNLYINPASGNDGNNGASQGAATKTIGGALKTIIDQPASIGQSVNLNFASGTHTLSGTAIDMLPSYTVSGESGSVLKLDDKKAFALTSSGAVELNSVSFDIGDNSSLSLKNGFYYITDTGFTSSNAQRASLSIVNAQVVFDNCTFNNASISADMNSTVLLDSCAFNQARGPAVTVSNGACVNVTNAIGSAEEFLRISDGGSAYWGAGNDVCGKIYSADKGGLISVEDGAAL